MPETIPTSTTPSLFERVPVEITAKSGAPLPPPPPIPIPPTPSEVPVPDAPAGVHGGPTSVMRSVRGKTIVRKQFRCEVTGSDFYRWLEVPRTIRAPNDPFPDLFRANDQSPAQVFQTKFHGGLRAGQLRQHADAAVRNEFRKLLALGLPLMAAILRERHPEAPVMPDPGELFSAGTPETIRIRSSVVNDLKMFNDETDTYVGRHVSGDHGVHGSSILEPSSDEDFCPPLAPIARQNYAAIRAGYGIVKSCFPIHERGQLEIWTLLAPGRDSHTFIWRTGDGTF
jgi:hypothetical protein